MSKATAVIAKPIDPDGELYQQRAHQALPILVRQARAGSTILYSDLARELSMPLARNLNYVLGSVGTSLVELASRWRTSIPPLQAVVVNKEDGMPGAGFMQAFVDPQLGQGANKRRRKPFVDAMLAEVYAYQRWHGVLAAFGAKPLPTISPAELRSAGALRGHGGESEPHRALKEFIAQNPFSVGVHQRPSEIDVEHPLPSGDQIDVLFTLRTSFIAVEVKSAISPKADLIRGVFQCVKYDAVMNAAAKALNSDMDVEVLLAIESPRNVEIERLANTLGVAVIFDVRGQVV